MRESGRNAPRFPETGCRVACHAHTLELSVGDGIDAVSRLSAYARSVGCPFVDGVMIGSVRQLASKG